MFSLQVFFWMLLGAGAVYPASLTICASISNTEVWTNGVKAGIVPFTLDYDKPGSVLECRKAGFKTFRKEIENGDTNLFVRMLSTNSHFSFLKQIRTGISPKDILFSPDGNYLMITLLDERRKLSTTCSGTFEHVNVQARGWRSVSTTCQKVRDNCSCFMGW